MKNGVTFLRPDSDADWQQLLATLNGGTPNSLLEEMLASARSLGTHSVVIERCYIDRDFSAAYSAFYSGLFRPMSKHCQRVHFFCAEIEQETATSAAGVVAAIEEAAPSYLGNLVLRPLPHAPVSSAHLSAAAIAKCGSNEVGVRSTFRFHLLGVELRVDSMPLTQQDTRTGACAQATMWMAGRHFQNRHGAPWFSLPAITSIALNPADQNISRSLPAGSDFLTPDNMVRALRAMGRHPVMYAQDYTPDGPKWLTVNPSEIVCRYVESGIPVILGMLKEGEQIGHAVVAVGIERFEAPAPDKDSHTHSRFCKSFLVHDDQRGVYRRLPIGDDNTEPYPFRFDRDIRYLIVPIPEKVFVTAEVAELIAADTLKQISVARFDLARSALGDAAWNVGSEVYDNIVNDRLIARTYLTYGWKYKARMLRNGASERLTSELLLTEFPRYVWVTEFSTLDSAAQTNPCDRRIVAHAVVDATGSRFWGSALVADTPGLTLTWLHDPAAPTQPVRIAVRADDSFMPYMPKIRGSIDYSVCAPA